MTFADQFFSCLGPKTYSLEDWEGIAHQIVESLEEFLSLPIKANSFEYYCIKGEPGFHANISNRFPMGGLLNFSWFGFIQTAAYAANWPRPSTPFVAAWIFCRIMDERVITNEERHYLYITYEDPTGAGPSWINHGWNDDTFGEFVGWNGSLS